VSGHAPEAADDGGRAEGEVALGLLLDDLAGEFTDITRRETHDGVVTFSVGERVFARMTGSKAEFRLRPEIAAAAARTPDARRSPADLEWVVFQPRSLDQHGIDRAQAWFELGHRLAVESKSAGRQTGAR
jgi:hypothetical protein